MWNFDGDIDALKTSDKVWDDETGETVAQAFARFQTLGDWLIPNEDAPTLVPQLVRAGFELWSFGYGDDPVEFTTIDIDSIGDDDFDDFSDSNAIWGPFRFDRTLGGTTALVRFGIQVIDDYAMSPFLSAEIRNLLAESAGRIAVATNVSLILRPVESILGTSAVSDGRE